MKSDDILGTWQSSIYIDGRGMSVPYDRQKLTFFSNGSGNMRAKTLFKRNSDFTWTFDGELFHVHNLGGPGAIAIAVIEDGRLIMNESGLIMIYQKS